MNQPVEDIARPGSSAGASGVEQGAAPTPFCGFISTEVFLAVGRASPPREVARWPAMQLYLASRLARLHLLLDPRRQDWFARDLTESALRIHIRPDALEAWLPGEACGRLPLAGSYFASPEMAAAADDILAHTTDGPARELFLSSRGLGLVWLVLEALRSGALQMCAKGDLSAADVGRLHAARRLIHECYGEPLTLDAIARACGLSRSKLTEGFRHVFKSSVGEALSERRLQQAVQALRSTDVAVACIGYRVGYTSNAAFTRAFTRRFGEPPTALRTRRSQPGAVGRTLAAVEAIL